MKNKKIVIVGAGPGGLAAGMILSSKGYEVKIYEKQKYIGGRNAEITAGDFKFDLGPTFFIMKDVLENIFKNIGKNLHDYITLKEIEPMYRLYFNKETVFKPYRDVKKMVEEMERVFPGNENGLLQYLDKERKKFDKLIPCLSIPYGSPTALLKKQFLSSIPHLDFHKSLYGVLSRYFDNELLKLSFTFQAKYTGMSPWEVPGTFSILSFIEHSEGIYHVMGGLNKINDAMAKIIKQNGGKIYTNKGVEKIIIENKKAIGVKLENGKNIFADDFVINADFSYAMTNLVDERNRKKYTNVKLDEKKYSCSTFMIYLGIDKIYHNIEHHSILFSPDYEKNIYDITKELLLSEDPSIYVQNPAVTDKSLAPEGKSSIYILVPVANQDSFIDWKNNKEKFRDKVLKLVEKKGGFKDISEHIEKEIIITPNDWEKEKCVYKGATFNLGHNISQILIFRPHNKFEEFDNCFLVGGGTHPGSGLPTIYKSAQITSDLILNRKDN